MCSYIYDAIWESPLDVALGHFQEIGKIGCQNEVFIQLLFYNILSIISENILAKLSCLVQKNSDLLQQAEKTVFLLC